MAKGGNHRALNKRARTRMTLNEKENITFRDYHSGRNCGPVSVCP